MEKGYPILLIAPDLYAYTFFFFILLNVISCKFIKLERALHAKKKQKTNNNYHKKDPFFLFFFYIFFKRKIKERNMKKKNWIYLIKDKKEKKVK